MFDSIVEAVAKHAEKYPDRLCLADDRGSVSYRAFYDMILRYAAYLREGGIEHGDYVVVEAAQSIEYLATELAIQLLGAVFVPTERNCAPEKIRSFAALCSAKGVITASAYDYDAPFVRVFDAFVNLDGEGAADFRFPKRGDVSEILFSTGTTGKEKGIIITHANDIALAQNVISGVEMLPDNVEMILSPMNHSHGLRRWYANMYNGSSVVLLGSAMDMMRFYRNIETYGVNSIDMVPAALSVVLKLSRGKLANYSDQLRYIQLGAAPIKEADQAEICRQLPKTRLYNFYGSTESGCIVIYNFNRPDSKKKCIGKPTANAEILIVDDDRRPIEDSAADNPGLLACRGAMNTPGYWQDPEETARVLENGVVYTNDIAYFDADGDLILLGRKGDVINIGGHKVAPEEIENIAARMPDIADCGVIPYEDPMRGTCAKLVVQLKPGVTLDTIRIRSFLAERLEPYKVPACIEQIDKIPRTFNGKLLRRELK